MVGYRLCCISWLTSFFRSSFPHFQPFSHSHSQPNPLPSHHSHQQLLFPFPTIHRSSALCTLNQQQNTILNRALSTNILYSLIYNCSWYALWITSLTQLPFHYFHHQLPTMKPVHPVTWLLSLGTIFSSQSIILPIVLQQSLFSIFCYPNGKMLF